MFRPASRLPCCLMCATGGGPALVLAKRVFSGGGSHAAKSISPLRRLQAWIQAFVAGSKALWQDHKAARVVRQKLQQGASLQALTGRERRLLRQTPDDVTLAVPLVLFFCMPVLGYAAPLIGLAFPRLLLPPQFWTEGQHQLFAQQTAQELRLTGQPRVVELLRNLGGELSAVRPAMLPREVAKLGDAMSARGPGDLRRLSRHQMLQLVDVATPMPWYRRKLAVALPSDMVRRMLEARARAISDDDHDIRADGLDTLSARELLRACYERQLQVDDDAHVPETAPPQLSTPATAPASTVGQQLSAGSSALYSAARQRLSAWLEMTRPDMGKGDVPASLVLCAPALIAGCRLEDEVESQTDAGTSTAASSAAGSSVHKRKHKGTDPRGTHKYHTSHRPQ